MSNDANVGKVYNLTGGGGGNSSLRLESLAVTRQPNKTTYKSGEIFDPTGMVVTGTYAFDLTSDVTGYTVSPSVLTDDVTEILITYTEGRVTKTTSVAVTVEKVLVSIAVTTPPTKTTYNYLEKFQPDGMAVTATFSDGSTAAATGYSYPATEFSTLGKQTVNLDWTFEGVTKSTTLDVTVNPIEVPVPTQKDIPTYDGTAKSPVWDDYDSVKMVLDGRTSEVNAGDNYGVTFTLNYGYVFPDGANSVAVKWKIERAVIAAIPVQIDIPAADGSPKSPSWSGYDPAKMTISGDRTGSEAGDYTANFTPTPNYQWWDGTITAKDAPWVIISILVTIPTQKNIPTYDGSMKTPEWDNFDTEYSTVQMTSMENAGEYVATFSLLKGMWTDKTTAPKMVKWKIKRAVIAAVPKQVDIPTYDGNPKTPAWDSNYNSVKMTVNVEAAVNAGPDYPASFTPTGNYQWWDETIEAKYTVWAINRASIATVPSQSVDLTYNGSEQSVTLKDYNSTQLTLGGTIKGTNAGEYEATATPTANYQWSDGTTTSKPVKWTIAKKAGSMSLSATTVTLDRTNLTKNITVTREGVGAVSASSSDTSVATVRVSVNELTIMGKANGSAVITVKVGEGKNHTAPGDEKINVTVQLSNIYGVEWDWENTSSTRGVRTDDATLFGDPNPSVYNGSGFSPFDNLMPWAGMVKETRAGGVEVKEPKYWFKWTKTGKKLKLQIADGPVEGFHVDPVNMDRGDGLGELDFSYIGRYHCVEGWKSESNKAQKVNITRSAARAGIHGLGTNFWQMDFAQMWYVGMLYLVEFADWDGQATIGYGCSAINYEAENNGKTDTMPYHTGTTAGTRTTYGYTQYRNIEGWWDNVYDFMDGCYYSSNGLNVILNPNLFSDNANGILVGPMPWGGYPNDMAIPEQSGFEWALYPVTMDGSENTYVPDFWAFSYEYTVLSHGGYYYNGQYHGPFAVHCALSNEGISMIGCRLQERPPKTT